MFINSGISDVIPTFRVPNGARQATVVTKAQWQCDSSWAGSSVNFCSPVGSGSNANANAKTLGGWNLGRSWYL